MYIPLKPLFSRHNGIGVQFTDEPTGSLDRENTDIVMDILEEYYQHGKTVVIVTHDAYVKQKGRRVIEL